MAIQLAIEDTTGAMYPESYHVITAVHTDGLAQTCMLKIQIWVNAAAFAAQPQKSPISYDGWGRDFYVINCTPAEYAIMANDPIVSGDVGLPTKVASLKRAYQWLMQQNAERTGGFDYTQGIVA